ncbi:MAG: helix-turn-helix transcriptional regulator [Phycisphaeraceae bacterium]|nr:helix-turn-helix transcriptional regulator [Phycisphaeraceae bacterium]
MKTLTPPSRTLREALENCGQTRAEVSRQTGIDQAVLSRFVRGECALHSDNADKLAAYLGLELRPVRRVKGRA